MGVIETKGRYGRRGSWAVSKEGGSDRREVPGIAGRVRAPYVQHVSNMH